MTSNTAILRDKLIRTVKLPATCFGKEYKDTLLSNRLFYRQLSRSVDERDVAPIILDKIYL